MLGCALDFLLVSGLTYLKVRKSTILSIETVAKPDCPLEHTFELEPRSLSRKSDVSVARMYRSYARNKELLLI